MIRDFFESNSISLEVIEEHEINKLCMTRVAALKQTRSKMLLQYADDPEADVIIKMTVYYCGLLEGYRDESAKKRLSELTEDYLVNLFGSDDGNVMYGVLQELLIAEPSYVPAKKKARTSPGHNWQPGEVYLYRPATNGETGILEGKRVVIVCLDSEPMSQRICNKTVYLLICDEDKVDMTLDDMLVQCDYLAAGIAPHKVGCPQKANVADGPVLKMYKYYISNDDGDYPTERVDYIGKVNRIPTPENEYDPMSYLYYKWQSWRLLDHWVEYIYGKMIRNK